MQVHFEPHVVATIRDLAQVHDGALLVAADAPYLGDGRIDGNSQQARNFDLRDKNQRPGRNPKTGEEIPISARRVVTFRPGQKLKARVEAYAGTRE